MNSNQDLPITAMCIVAESSKCPTNYIPIVKSHDTNTEIDLWKDGLFGRKINRFVCFTKDYPIADTYYVVEDIKILGEKDNIIGGFVAIDKCQDTNEKAFQKKVLCIKVSHRYYTTMAVSDIIVLVRSKRAPIGYSFIGEINNHQICIKFSQIPTNLKSSISTNLQTPLDNGPSSIRNSASYSQLQPPPRPPRPDTFDLGYVHIDLQNASSGMNGYINNNNNINNTSNQLSDTVQRVFQSQTSVYNPLQGVPFEINPIYYDRSKKNQDEIFDVERLNRKLLAMNENFEKYNYDFKLEKSCLSV